jgi:hypothetical protein
VELNNLLDERELSLLLGRAVSSLQKDRLRGDGVPFIRVGRQVRYRRADVESWLASRPLHGSTSDPGSRAA